MEKITAFDVFAKMNRNDAEKNTATLPVSTYLHSCQQVKAGMLVTMGVEIGLGQKLALSASGVGGENYKAVLMIYSESDYKAAEAELKADEM